ncbi:MAG: hypothetical protein U0P81_11700 [Holophagaceae bacterium]
MKLPAPGCLAATCAAALAAQQGPVPLAQALPARTRQVVVLHDPVLAPLKLQALQGRLHARVSALALLGPEFALPKLPKPAGGVARVTLDRGAVLFLATDAAALAEKLEALPADGGWRFYHQGKGYLLGARRGWSVVADESRQTAWAEALRPGAGPVVAPLDDVLDQGDLAVWGADPARAAEALDALAPFPVPEAFRALLAVASRDSRDAALSLALDPSGDALLVMAGRPKPDLEAVLPGLGRAEAWGLADLPPRPWSLAMGGCLPPRWLGAFAELRAWRPEHLPPALDRALDAAQREVTGFGLLRSALPEPEALRLDTRDREAFRDALARAAATSVPAGGEGAKTALASLDAGRVEDRDAFTLNLPDPDQGPLGTRAIPFLQSGDRGWRVGPVAEGPGLSGVLTEDEALREAAGRLPSGAAFYAFENPRALWLAEARRLNEEREGLDPDLRDRCPVEPEPPEAPPFGLAVAFQADRWTFTCSLPAATQLALARHDAGREKGRGGARRAALEEQQARLARGKQ